VVEISLFPVMSLTNSYNYYLLCHIIFFTIVKENLKTYRYVRAVNLSRKVGRSPDRSL
jgi:hypothetical protein